MSRTIGGWAAVGALLAAIAFGAPGRAHACGGFFCSAAQPVNQTAERIVFVHHDDGTMTAIIEILYEGPSNEFAWVIPAPGVPEVGVSSGAVLDRLQAQTNPIYQLTTRIEGSCEDSGGCTFPAWGGLGDSDPSFALGGPSADAGASAVSVEGTGAVGPYEWVSISVDPTTPDPADAAVDWLVGAGYDVSELGRDRLRPYLEEGQNLLAFRLQKEADVGSIVPVQLRYESPCPAIPLRPTAVAAVEDMGILVWIFGPARAVPLNYFELELNEAAIDWQAPSTNYDEVVTAAADEAGGHGFVTEMAGTTLSSNIQLALDPGFDVVSLAANAYSSWDVLWQLAQAFPGSAELGEIVRAAVSFPSSFTYEDWIACPSCGWGDAEPSFDPWLLDVLIDERLRTPLAEAQALVDETSYVTRLYTTMSAEEMNVDPTFDFNPDLPGVSNVHTAERVVYCRRRTSTAEAPWRIEVNGGESAVRGEGSTWPPVLESGAPATFRVLQQSTEGPPVVIQENATLIDDGLAAASPKGDGCSSGGWPGRVPLLPLSLVLALGALFARSARRRRA